MKLLLMAEGKVGMKITEWLLDKYRNDVKTIVTIAPNEIEFLALSRGVCGKIEGDYDLGICAWWPKIIKEPLRNLPKHGFINTHPSFLPYNRGKHTNFWAIVKGEPFGVTIHMIDKGIDTGAIIAQEAISFDWTDTGETIYKRVQKAMVRLFKATYPSLRKLNFSWVKQDLSRGSFHKAKELEMASWIKLDTLYTGRELLNLLRARTFTGYPACWFEDNGKKYEARIEIKREG